MQIDATDLFNSTNNNEDVDPYYQDEQKLATLCFINCQCFILKYLL